MLAGVIKAKTINSTSDKVLTINKLLTNELPFSITQLKLNGKNKLVKNKICDAVYYILQGSGKFIINGNETEVEQGDLIFLPKNTTYQDEGVMTMLSVYYPPFDSKQVEYPEK